MSSSERSGRDIREWLIAAALFGATIALYFPALGYGFIELDDADYIYENAHVLNGFSLDGIAWAFTTFHAGNWHPLTWLSHMLDCEWARLDAGGHHRTSIFLHAVNSVLLFIFLHRATGARWRSAWVSALFAWHPLHIQSVVWLSERKDVLSGFFWMIMLLAYLAYVRRPSLWRYAGVFAIYPLALMSKPMAVSFPMVLLLLDWWPLHRFGAGPGLRSSILQLVTEKLPLILLAAATCGLTLAAQQGAGAVLSVAKLPWSHRLANAALSYVAYLQKTVWPQDLAIIYPYPRVFVAGQVASACLFLVVVSAVALRVAERRPYFAAGWFWYLVALLPVIGIVQVGAQSMADRYTYLPMIGVFIAVAWGASDLFRTWRNGKAVASMCGIAVTGLLFVQAEHQLRYWSSSEKLFRRAIAVTRENSDAHDALGNSLLAVRKTGEAIQEYEEALRTAPDNIEAHNNLAYAQMTLHRYPEAISHLRQALEIDPRFAKAQNNLGDVLFKQGQFADALPHYEEAARLDADRPEIQFNLGNALVAAGRKSEAIPAYQKAIHLRPSFAEAHNNLGLLLLEQQNLVEATRHFSAAVQAAPAFANAQVNLATCLLMMHQPAQAVASLKNALRNDPNSVPALRDLARLRATHRDASYRDAGEALRLAQRAAELTNRKDPFVLGALAAALAEAGRPDKAVEVAVEAHALAIVEARGSLAAEIERQLALYRSGMPSRRDD